MYVEQARGQALNPLRRVLLWAHLVRCANCRRYARQSRLVEELARWTFPSATTSPGLQQRLGLVLREAGFRIS